jgi:hypothetical protein
MVLFVQDAVATPLTFAGADACLGVPPPGPTFVCQSPASSSSVSLLTTLTLSGASLTVNAHAASAYGVLRASETISFNTAGQSEEAFGDALATFQDDLTINSAALTGQLGKLNIAYTLDGVVSPSSGLGNSFARVVANVGTNPSYAVDHTSSVSGVFVIPQSFTFIYGQPFALGFLLEILTGGVSPTANGGFFIPQVNGVGSAGSDFFNTMVLSGLVPTDINGNVVANATFSSSSGTVYGVNGVVPEPAGVVLLGTGLVGVAIQRWRNRTREG